MRAEAVSSPAASAWSTRLATWGSASAQVGVAAGAALVLGGVAELVAWARHRREFIPARDQLWTGLVGLLSGGGVVVAALQGFGPHALLGIAGGGAILIGVLLMVSGLGFHHEVRRDRGTARGL